jgi:MFS family permease
MLAYGLWQTYYGLVYAAIQDLVAPALRGTAMALYFLAMYLCGGAFGPLILGALSDHFARTTASRAAGLQQAMYIIPAASVLLSLVLWAGSTSTTRPTDRLSR